MPPRIGHSCRFLIPCILFGDRVIDVVGIAVLVVANIHGRLAESRMVRPVFTISELGLVEDVILRDDDGWMYTPPMGHSFRLLILGILCGDRVVDIIGIAVLIVTDPPRCPV